MTQTVTVTLSTLACESSILFTHSLLIFSQGYWGLARLWAGFSRPWDGKGLDQRMTTTEGIWDLARNEAGIWLGMGWDRTMVDRVSSLLCSHTLRKILFGKEIWGVYAHWQNFSPGRKYVQCVELTHTDRISFWYEAWNISRPKNKQILQLHAPKLGLG